MLNLLLGREQLATKWEDLLIQADEFLESNGFPVDQDHRALFCQFVQMTPADQDWYNPKVCARSMRKALVNHAAFFVMKPEKRPTKEIQSETAQEPTAPVATTPQG